MSLPSPVADSTVARANRSGIYAIAVTFMLIQRMLHCIISDLLPQRAARLYPHGEAAEARALDMVTGAEPAALQARFGSHLREDGVGAPRRGGSSPRANWRTRLVRAPPGQPRTKPALPHEESDPCTCLSCRSHRACRFAVRPPTERQGHSPPTFQPEPSGQASARHGSSPVAVIAGRPTTHLYRARPSTRSTQRARWEPPTTNVDAGARRHGVRR